MIQVFPSEHREDGGSLHGANPPPPPPTFTIPRKALNMFPSGLRTICSFQPSEPSSIVPHNIAHIDRAIELLHRKNGFSPSVKTQSVNQPISPTGRYGIFCPEQNNRLCFHTTSDGSTQETFRADVLATSFRNPHLDTRVQSHVSAD